MNKFITKVAKLVLGLSLAAGVGVAVGSQKASRADATETSATLSAGSNSVAIKVNYNSAGAPASNNGVRVSTSSNVGSATFSVPSGTTSFGFSAVGWKGKSVTASITASVGTPSASSVSLTANDAATGTINANTTVAITGTDANVKKTFTISGVTSASTITLSTSSSEKRAIFWDAWYEIGAAFGTLDHIKITTPATKTTFTVGDTFSSAGLVLTGYDAANEGTANTETYTSGYTTNYDSHTFVAGDVGTGKTVTVTYSGKSATYTIDVEAAADIVLDKDNKPYTSTVSSNTDEENVTLHGVQYHSYAAYIYNSNYLAFNRSQSGAYVGNNTTFSKNIKKIVVDYFAGGTPYMTMYEGSSALAETTTVSPGTTGTGKITYTFSDSNPFFKLKLTTTGTYCNITSISIYLGSALSGPTVSSVSVTGNMSKTSYTTVDSWSNSGLTANVTMSDNSAYTGAIVWDYSPTSPAAYAVLNDGEVTSGSVEATATAVDKSGSKSTTGISVSYATVADAIDAAPASGNLPEVVVQGIVSRVETLSSGALTYYISDDGSTTGELEVFKGKGLSNASFSSTDDLQQGDEVLVFGELTTYNSSPEIPAGSYLLSFNRPVVTVSSLEVLDDQADELSDGDEVNLVASAGSVSTDITCEVTYSNSTHDGNVTITSSPSAGFSQSTSDNETYTLTFSANGDYDVIIEATADDSFAITVTYHVSGITAVVYQKVTSASNLKAGSEFIIGKSDGTYVMSKYSGSGNNCASLSVTPTDSNNIPASAIPSGYAVLTLSGSASGWTLTDQDSKIYYGTSGQNHLKSSDSATDTWTISISSGVATITSAASSRSIKKNQSSALFSTYSSGQHDISIYMIPSTNPAIEVEVTGSTSLAVGGTATLTATKINGATGTVNWATNNAHVSLSSSTGDSITVTGETDGTSVVTASLTGGSTVDPVATTFTVTKALSSIAVTTAPTKTTYTEGESFDTTGMVVTATYDDTSTETPNDYTWSPNGALTPSDTTITISWGGKTTTQAITVNAKVVTGIAVQALPTKNSYHAGEEFVSTGLTIRVTYEGGSTADITSGFTISPASYTFTAADETAGSKTFTVTYSEKSTTFNVTVAGITGPIQSGRYYIMNSNKTFGLNAVAATSGSPTALDLSASNELTAFDVELKADNEYEISVTINDVKYLLVCNTTATSSSNTSIRVTNSPAGGLASTYWNLDDSGVETDGAYYVKENTVGSTYRYLACYSTTDWRGYTGASGDREIQFVPEGSYAGAIADSLLNDLSCNNGATAPSTSVWSDISDAYGSITIAHEKALLTGGTANENSEDTVEQALAKYDYVVGKYLKGQGLTDYNDFLGRDPAQIGGARVLISNVVNENTNTVAIIVVISMVSVTAIGGYFFLKKRREQN